MFREIGEDHAQLLEYANKHYGCCGIHRELNCSLTHTPVEICHKGAPLCHPGCYYVIINEIVAPFLQTMAAVAFIMGVLGVTEISLAVRKVGHIFVRG